MPRDVVPPSTSLKSFSCPHCNAHASQTWYKVAATQIKDNQTPDNIFNNLIMSAQTSRNVAGIGELQTYLHRVGNGEIFLHKIDSTVPAIELANGFVSVCYSCGKPAVWLHDAIIYPRARYELEPNKDLSDEIKSYFNEAREIIDISPRGAAALLRLCIQRICSQIGKPGKNINEDIAALVKEGLDPRVQQALDFVRVIGNEAVHPGQIDFADNRDVATSLFNIVNSIAYSLITHPREIDAMYNSLPQRKRDEISRRDAQK